METPDDLFYYFLESKRLEKAHVIELVEAFNRYQIIYLRDRLKMRLNMTETQLSWDCHRPAWYQIMLKDKQNLIDIINWLANYLSNKAIAG